ncbi:hypothetical protein L596_019740 [Steinernema carpocapsae]|uniref:Uncharacterized protein n=1 Tax=Steinernema carpocapsae TaxID=34508 RepID=A0A4U5MRF8_STECR|nr:hypothetical protein L596_019740 [Steinernema carpocapsae]
MVEFLAFLGIFKGCCCVWVNSTVFRGFEGCRATFIDEYGAESSFKHFATILLSVLDEKLMWFFERRVHYPTDYTTELATGRVRLSIFGSDRSRATVRPVASDNWQLSRVARRANYTKAFTVLALTFTKKTPKAIWKVCPPLAFHLVLSIIPTLLSAFVSIQWLLILMEVIPKTSGNFLVMLWSGIAGFIAFWFYDCATTAVFAQRIHVLINP